MQWWPVNNYIDIYIHTQLVQFASESHADVDLCLKLNNGMTH